ncbi:hypothetical protein [Mycoplasma sp. E35C]|uniref:hypothetical protein n=1 Tax=Mycoplasma sp. E35C TaxID=2801918 RepID=UPI001CA40432|nr:hypothetical protein [Mycoplasma sp. E35C]QZX49071.1 hypothetical protein JJE79_03370 [Mycoplasma sp. E35C]
MEFRTRRILRFISYRSCVCQFLALLFILIFLLFYLNYFNGDAKLTKDDTNDLSSIVFSYLTSSVGFVFFVASSYSYGMAFVFYINKISLRSLIKQHTRINFAWVLLSFIPLIGFIIDCFIYNRSIENSVKNDELSKREEHWLFTVTISNEFIRILKILEQSRINRKINQNDLNFHFKISIDITSTIFGAILTILLSFAFWSGQQELFAFHQDLYNLFLFIISCSLLIIVLCLIIGIVLFSDDFANKQKSFLNQFNNNKHQFYKIVFFPWILTKSMYENDCFFVNIEENNSNKEVNINEVN